MDNFSENYLIYLRKSRKDVEAEARGEGETLARHERTLLELARRQRLNVTDIYREIVSGETIASRPIMQRVLAEVEQGLWAGVLVMEIERLARGDTIDQGIIAQTFKFSDTKIITPLKTYDPNDEYDEEYFEFGLFMSRREYKTINRRLQRGKLAASKEGKWVPNRAPYGYRRVKLENEKGFSLEPIEEQTAVVRLIFEMYSGSGCERKTPGAIVRYLNDAGIAAPGGGDWRKCSVHSIIDNPAYMGMIRWGYRPSKKKVLDGQVRRQRGRLNFGEYELFPARHPAIISKELFYAAQEIRTSGRSNALPIDYVLQNPLSGLVVCSKCGHTMIRRCSASRPQGSLVCSTRNCPTVSSDLPVVEERVLQGLAGWLGNYELEWEEAVGPAASSAVAAKQKILASSERELEKLYKQLDRAHDLLEQGVYDTDTFLTRSRTLSQKINESKAGIDRVSKELAEAEEREARQRDIIPKVKKLLEVYPSLPSAEDRNGMLKEVIEKIVYTKDTPGTKKIPADRFDLVIYPRLPRK